MFVVVETYGIMIERGATTFVACLSFHTQQVSENSNNLSPLNWSSLFVGRRSRSLPFGSKSWLAIEER